MKYYELLVNAILNKGKSNLALTTNKAVLPQILMHQPCVIITRSVIMITKMTNQY